MASSLHDPAFGQPSLPDGWSWRWLNEVMDIRGGAQPEASTFIGEPRPGYIRFVQIRDFDTDGHVTYIKDSHKWRKCLKSDVLIARYGASLGRILRGIQGAYNVALVKAEPTNVEKSFLYYLLRSKFFQGPIIRSGARSAQSGFNKSDLSVIPVPVPPVREQRGIAAILGALDDKIELNRELCATLEAAARALFKSWFVNFDPVRIKAAGTDPDLPANLADLFPDSFEDSELGEIPRGWHVGGLTEYATILSGGTPKTNNPEYWNGPIRWASAKDVSQAKSPFLVKTERSITERGLTESATQIIPAFSTVIVARGATTGRMTLFGRDMAMNQTCYALVSKSHTPFTLYHTLREKIADLVHAAHGSVFDTVTTATFSAARAVVAPLNVMASFEALAAPMHLRILAAVQESQTLTDIRDTLLPKLISGEMRVGDAERIMAESA